MTTQYGSLGETPHNGIGKTKAWNVAKKSDQSQTTLCKQTITTPTAHKKVYEKPFADSVHLLGNQVQV